MLSAISLLSSNGYGCEWLVHLNGIQLVLGIMASKQQTVIYLSG